MGKMSEKDIQEANRIVEIAREKQALLEAERAEMGRKMFEDDINRLAGNPAPRIRAKR